jgi:MFS transporter, YNFM family, putative membrane transport protein
VPALDPSGPMSRPRAEGSAPAPVSTAERQYLRPGTPEFRWANIALVIGGAMTYALLYTAQPVLPLLADEFRVSAAASSLAVSLSTGFLAPMLVVASSLSEASGRKMVMVISLIAAAILSIAAGLAPDFSTLLVARALEGVALSGLPAVAIAYLGEEMDPRSLGRAIGFLVAGNAFGGLFGRVAAAGLADLISWRWGPVAIGIMGLVGGVLLWRFLPPSQHFRRQRLNVAGLTRSLATHIVDPGLRWINLMGFLIAGAFVTVYNYLSFRLTAPPYGLSQSAVGAIFLAYLIGMVGSSLAGQLSDSIGRGRVLWVSLVVMLAGVLLTLCEDLWLVIAGVLVMTFGFFGAHSIASSWVSHRAHAAKAQASALYLFSYYMGSSILGSLGGFVWTWGAWPGIVAAVATTTVLALLISLRLSGLPAKTAA